MYSDPETQLHTYPNGSRAHFMSVVFSAEIVEKVAEPSEESAAVSFFTVDDLPEAVFPADHPVLEELASKREGPFIG